MEHRVRACRRHSIGRVPTFHMLDADKGCNGGVLIGCTGCYLAVTWWLVTWLSRGDHVRLRGFYVAVT